MRKKFTNRTHVDGGVSEIEELVHAGKDDGSNKTDDPSTEGRRRHRGIICVGNRRTDFWIWGFIFERRGRWVKIWVIVVVDSNVLSVPDQVCQLFSSFPIQLEGSAPMGRKITDKRITLMTRRGLVIDLTGPLLLICL